MDGLDSLLKILGPLGAGFICLGALTMLIMEFVANWLHLKSKFLTLALHRLLKCKSNDPFMISLCRSPQINPLNHITEHAYTPSYIEPNSFAEAILQMLYGNTLEKSKQKTKEKCNAELSNFLSTVFETTKNNRDDAKKIISEWFSNAMTLATIAYRRTMVFWLFIVGLLISIAGNINLIYVIKMLQSRDVSVELLRASGANQMLAADAYAQLQTTSIGWGSDFDLYMLLDPTSIIGWLLSASFATIGAQILHKLYKTRI